MRGIRRALLATLGALAISIGGLTLPNSGAAWADEPEETIIIVELGTTQEEIDAAGLDLDVAEAKLAIPSLACEEGGGAFRTLAPPPDCTNGTSCNVFCGVVHNRSGKTLNLSRDSSSHTSCSVTGPYGNLPSGKSSNSYFGWRDTDCFRSTTHRIFYRGWFYGKGSWIRIYNGVWIY
ncbi:MULTISPECIES: hypothetical protein [Micromonospora]|uniref:hypothetical protein n=1 Tax=Micromonospora TaxID=1873 RepID=UPI0007DB1DD9|nr:MULTISPECIES: hypothetical protein [Micromonospora]MBQ1061168.1 hypothetical protein [Micromonospora sp. C41]WDP99205.1 hypothetical protein PVK74_25650 [Micromonospora chalcea]